MPRKKNKDKENAPFRPPNTCPYIDAAIALIEDMMQEDNEDWRRSQGNLVKNYFELLRTGNEQLRLSSLYWYERYKEVSDK